MKFCSSALAHYVCIVEGQLIFVSHDTYWCHMKGWPYLMKFQNWASFVFIYLLVKTPESDNALLSSLPISDRAWGMLKDRGNIFSQLIIS